MTQRHWLDPLARKLLIATGQLPAPARSVRPQDTAATTTSNTAASNGATSKGATSNGAASNGATSNGTMNGDPAAAGISALQAALPAAGPRPGSSPAAAAVASRPPTGTQPWWQVVRSAIPSANQPPAATAEADPQEAIERDLLALQLAQQPGRSLRNGDEVRRAAALGWRLDVNRATAADWLRLPGCTADQADLLQRLQAGGVQLSGPDDLQRLLQLEPSLLDCWLPLLEFRWYGSPAMAPIEAIAINSAPAATLQRLEGLEPARLEQLLQARRQKPFRDLADLQQRLGLPASVIEAWIGRLSFEPPPPGPRLPPSLRRGR